MHSVRTIHTQEECRKLWGSCVAGAYYTAYTTRKANMNKTLRTLCTLAGAYVDTCDIHKFYSYLLASWGTRL